MYGLESSLSFKDNESPFSVWVQLTKEQKQIDY